MDSKSPHPALPRLTLVLGGARSGKSRHAEALSRPARRLGPMSRPRRPSTTRWRRGSRSTERAASMDGPRSRRPLDLADVVTAQRSSGAPILIDCLTLWLSNVMLDGRDVDAACGELGHGTGRSNGPIVVVSNEVGLGIVPDNALARMFRDGQGRLNQEIAACADSVILMAAGLPLKLK